MNQALASPEHIERWTMLMEGARPEQFTIDRVWQRLLPAERLSAYHQTPPEGPWCLLELQRPYLADKGAHAPAPAASSNVKPSVIASYQRPSLFVQSEDARIKAKAVEVVGQETQAWPRVTALSHWVFSTITKQLTVGMSSAVDILATPVGDCHEHTILFTALARSLGVPTRMIAGLVYWQGRLYYHAWPEVWVEGQWIPTDPTFDQPVADATHVALVEAEGDHLSSLAQFVGKLRVRVLEVKVSDTF